MALCYAEDLPNISYYGEIMKSLIFITDSCKNNDMPLSAEELWNNWELNCYMEGDARAVYYNSRHQAKLIGYYDKKVYSILVLFENGHFIFYDSCFDYCVMELKTGKTNLLNELFLINVV